MKGQPYSVCRLTRYHGDLGSIQNAALRFFAPTKMPLMKVRPTFFPLLVTSFAPWTRRISGFELPPMLGLKNRTYVGGICGPSLACHFLGEGRGASSGSCGW